jgi:hypothetical protein
LTTAGLYRLFRLAMQLTKQQKIYAAVLGLAVAAFGFDRFVLGPGEDSVEEVAAAPSSGRPAPRRTPARPAAARGMAAQSAAAPAASASASASASTSTLAARLEAVAAARKLKLDSVGDAFKPSTAWVGTPKQVAPTGELVDAVAEFQKKKLTAVIKQGAGGFAVIDKIYLPVGQSMDGFRLVAVKDRSAILRRGNQRVELRLDESGTGTSGSGSASISGAGSGTTSEKVAATDAGH